MSKVCDGLTEEEINILRSVTEVDLIEDGAYNIRYNGGLHSRRVTNNIDISPKKDSEGIDINVLENTKNGVCFIPVIVSENGLSDKVYNDFYIGDNSEVTIYAGCGIHNCSSSNSEHSGIHRFYLGINSKVKYIEKHYGSGEGVGKKILNPVTEIYLKTGSYLEMITAQIEGVDSSIRETTGYLGDNSTLIIRENIKTHDNQVVKTVFDVNLEGENSSCHVISRAVATDNSKQEFYSNLVGNNKCYAHSECDAILEDNGKVIAKPSVIANSVDATLVHEATIGKIAGEQLMKLMTLGLNEKEAEEVIIKGFLK